MSAVKAATNATDGEMRQLSATAIALGADTELAGISASDAATAMEELGRGGVTVEQQLGGATRGALLLASAGAISVGEAASIATKAMNVFGLSGASVAHVADLLASGANKSATDVSQLGAAFNQSAAVAKNAGLSIEELTGTLAFLAQRGMEGSDAGTSLKTALLALQAPTDAAAATMAALGINVRDANGQMLPFADIADVLKSRLSGLSDAQRDAALKTIFGNDAIRVGIALYEGGGEAIRNWTAQVDDAGSAARTGKTLNDNLKGSFSQLQATIETGAITIGTKFLPIIRTATDETAALIQRVLDSPQAQRAIEDLATKGSAALKQFFQTVQDPAFQKSAREWLNAAVDTGRAIIDFAGTVKNVLGPPLQAAVGWFNNLDEGGKQNAVSFGLVALAAGKYHSELGNILNIIPSVIKAFAAKEAAKKTLTAANEALAGSAGKTATAVGGTTTAASAAAVAIADVAAVSLVSVGVAAGAATGFGALANALDQSGQRAKDNTQAWDAAAFAIAHGGNEVNNAVAGFVAYNTASGTVITSNDQMVAAWNRYLGSVQAAGGATTAAGLQMALATSAAGGLTAGVTALANSLPLVVNGLHAGAVATGRMTIGLGLAQGAMVEATIGAADLTRALSGAGLAIGAMGAASITASGHIASAGLAVSAFAGAVAGAQGAVDNYDKALQGLSTQHSHLQSYLQVLQAEWDKLDAATKKQGYTTAEQNAAYQRLAPAIQYLNAQIGLNTSAAIDATLAAVNQQQALDNTAKAASLGAIAQGGYRIGLDLATLAAQSNKQSTDDTTTALNVAREATDNLIGAFRRVPSDVSTQVATPGLSDADQGVRNYLGALNSIPSNVSTTITTHYDTVGSPAQASLAGFRANGGPVQPRRAYIVGERGPELFVPSSGGIISPNTGGFDKGGSGGGSGGTVNNITVTGNTLLQDEITVSQSLANILAPALSRQVSYSY